MLTEKEYLELKKQHQEGCDNNDYSKMIMIGTPKHLQMKEYEQFHCKHDGPGYIGCDNGHYCGLCNKKL
jgi:hypothetical protein